MPACDVCGAEGWWMRPDPAGPIRPLCLRCHADVVKPERYPAELYRGMPPHVATDTSAAAAASVRESAQTKRALIRAHLAACPSTIEEIEAQMGLRHQTAGPRVRELVLLGDAE